MAQNDLVYILFSFPTAAFAVGLGLCALFWTLMMVGLIDPDIGIDSTVVDLAPDAVDIGYGGAGGAFRGHRSQWKVGLSGVPPIFLVTLTLAFGFLLSLFAMERTATVLVQVTWVHKLLVGALSLAAGILATVVAVRPLAPLFRSAQSVEPEVLVGMECKVVTGRVTDSFGKGYIRHEGLDYEFEIRAKKENALKRHDLVKLLSYQAEGNFYFVQV